jgi:hypothetical protein
VVPFLNETAALRTTKPHKTTPKAKGNDLQYSQRLKAVLPGIIFLICVIRENLRLIYFRCLGPLGVLGVSWHLCGEILRSLSQT